MGAMLVELTVRNFAVIQEIRLALGPGLNVITGETGAGKSLLVDALEFVLGGRADRDLIRGDAVSANAEAVFHVPPNESWRASLEELGIEFDQDGTVALLREVHREERTLSRLNGRAVPLSTVRRVGALLVDIHGQGTHLSLLDQRFQLATLDAYAGLDAQCAAANAAIAELRRVRQELTTLDAATSGAERQRDLLLFQIGEIEDAAPRVGEEAELLREQELLSHAQAVQEACAAACEALYDGDASANDLIGRALLALQRSPDPRGDIARHTEALEAAAAQVEEAARGLRKYAESVEHDAARLEEIEERVELLRRLKRKYGGSEEAVLAFATRARRELEGIEHADERRAELAAACAAADERAGAAAWALSQARQRGAGALGDAVATELTGLGLGHVAFVAAVHHHEASDDLPGGGSKRYAFGGHGIDGVEFLVETNRGEGLKPLAKIASGGETSRVLLAIKGALREASGVATLVFDEVDSGLGGRAGDVVGRKLWDLSRVSQVLCVTHLPQIAAYADCHFRVDKSVLEDRTYARAQALRDSDRAAELAAMLGGRRTKRMDGAARELLERAARVKRELPPSSGLS